MKKLSKPFLGIAILGAIVTLAMLVMGNRTFIGVPVVTMFSAFALFSMGHAFLKKFAFTAWVFASVAASMFYPQWFLTWGGYDLNGMIVPLIQIIMFGMGTTLSIADFTRVFKMPWPILVCMVLQFGAKPLVALGTATMFGFTGEIAAGVVLIGSVPGGVASNLMTYLANGDVALSVTMTSCSTLISPVMTPFVMKVLGGKFISISFISMMFSILNMVIVPTLAGLIANKILYSKAKWANSVGTVLPFALVSTVIAALAIGVPGVFVGLLASLRNGILIGSFLLAFVTYLKLIINIVMKRTDNWMDTALPIISMFGIVMIIAIITSRSTDQLLSVGLALIVASLIQISVGYLLGYYSCRLLRMDEKTARTVSIEVGLQNGGMASALAMNVLKSAEAALASAVYGPLMNVTGSMLASWWHERPVKEGKDVKKA